MHKVAPKLVLMILSAIGMSIVAAAENDLDAAAVLETKMLVRDAWVEHVFWIRDYAFATRNAGADRIDVTEAQILANAQVLADSIRPFYGDAASDSLLELLAGHWNAVKTYNGATLEDSVSGQTRAAQSITSNAQEIAEFLSGANPYLPADAVFGLLSVHGAHHMAQIDQIEAGAFNEESQTWAAMRLHMHTIADSIVEALARQFPQEFGIAPKD